MEMKRVSLNGRIIRPIGKDFENTGILIVYSKHVKVTDMISAYVKYFRLDLNPEADFAYITDNEFICPYKYFVENFEILEENGPQQKWSRMG